MLLIASLALRAEADLVVYILDVGQGNCVFVADGAALKFFDCGSTSTPKPDLSGFLNKFRDKNGVLPLTLLVITHGDMDHYNLIPAQFGKVQVTDIRVGGLKSQYEPTSFYGWANDTVKVPIKYLTSDDRQVPAGDGTWLLAALSKADKNADSAVYKLERSGQSIMLTGDATGPTMTSILKYFDNRLLVTDVMLVPHHGGEEPPTIVAKFLNATQPRLLLFSAPDKSQYGHPRCVVIASWTTKDNLRLDRNVPSHTFTCYDGNKNVGLKQKSVSTTDAVYSTGGSGAIRVTLPDAGALRWDRCPNNDPAKCGSPMAAAVFALGATPVPSSAPELTTSMWDLLKIAAEPSFDVTVADRFSAAFDDLVNSDCAVTKVIDTHIGADCSTTPWRLFPNDRLTVTNVSLDAGSSNGTGYVDAKGKLDVAGRAQDVTIDLASGESAFKVPVDAKTTFAQLLDYLGTMAGEGAISEALPCPIAQFGPYTVSQWAATQEPLTVSFGQEILARTRATMELPGVEPPDVVLNAMSATVTLDKSPICIDFTYFDAPLRVCSPFQAVACRTPGEPPDPPGSRPFLEFLEKLTLKASVFAAAYVFTAGSEALGSFVCGVTRFVSGFFSTIFGGGGGGGGGCGGGTGGGSWPPDAVDVDALLSSLEGIKTARPDLFAQLAATPGEAAAGFTRAGAPAAAILASLAQEFPSVAPTDLAGAVVSAQPSTSPAVVATGLRQSLRADTATIAAALVSAYHYTSDGGGPAGVAEGLAAIESEPANVLAALRAVLPAATMNANASAIATAFGMGVGDARRLLTVLSGSYTVDPLAAAPVLQSAIDAPHNAAPSIADAIGAQYGLTVMPRDAATLAAALRFAGYSQQNANDALPAATAIVAGVFTNPEWTNALALKSSSATMATLARSVYAQNAVPPDRMVTLLLALYNLSTSPSTAATQLGSALGTQGLNQYNSIVVSDAARALFTDAVWLQQYAAFLKAFNAAP